MKTLNLGDPSIARPCDGIEVGVVFELYQFDPEADYVMPIGSIGRHRATGEYRAASDMRFLDYPNYECVYPSPPEAADETATTSS